MADASALVIWRPGRIYVLPSTISPFITPLLYAKTVSFGNKISSASAKSKEILGQIIELQEQAAECNLLQGRYATLRGQYVSDIKRLSFIVNGEVEMQKVAHNTICPFCDGKIPAKSKKSYIESAQAELHRITSQMNGLVETEKELASKLAHYMVMEGADTKPYGGILISGARTSLLHGIPGNKAVEYGDFVLMDYGCQYKGYLSDMTEN